MNVKPAVMVRGAIYMALAALPVWIAYFAGILDDVKANKPPIEHWAVWAYLASNSVYQSLLALRAYIDGSAERARVIETKPSEPTTT